MKRIMHALRQRAFALSTPVLLLCLLWGGVWVVGWKPEHGITALFVYTLTITLIVFGIVFGSHMDKAEG